MVIQPNASGPHPAFGHAMRELWPLRPGLLYLNHGTVGVTPRSILDEQARLRLEIEASPSEVLLRDIAGMMGEKRGDRLRVAAARVARFFGAEGKDLAFVDNATTGVNAVLQSLGMGAGDRVLIMETTYGGVREAVRHACRCSGAEPVVATLPCPVDGPEQVLECVEAAITDRVRIAIVDHIVSEIGLVLPVAELVELCHRHGIQVLVDGAHAAGQLDFEIPSLGADWYTTNLHKWALAPRSCGILWAAEDAGRDLHPTVISWNLGQGFTREFDWVGTRDVTPYLAAPAALDLLDELDFDALRAYNHRVVCEGTRRLAERWGTRAVGPESMTAFMTALELPPLGEATVEAATRLRDTLLYGHAIEVPVHCWRDRLWLRLSVQIYNELGDFDRLAEALETERGGG